MRQAEQAGDAFLVARDGDDELRLFPLAEGSPVLIGRHPDSSIVLDWDPQVSATHCEITRVGTSWTLRDDGLSRHGTRLNGIPIGRRVKLRHEDVLALGATQMAFCDPAPVSDIAATAYPASMEAGISPAQKAVLVELARPMMAERGTPPAGNEEIALALSLSVNTVKKHLSAAVRAFGLGRLPRGKKRAALVHAALERGVISPADLG